MKRIFLSLAVVGLAVSGPIYGQSPGSKLPSSTPPNRAAGQPAPPAESVANTQQPPQQPATGTPAVSGNPQPAAAVPNGYYLTGGVMYLIRDGRATPLDREMTFRVTPKGFVGFDGTAITLPAGHMLSMDGRYVPLPVAPAATTEPAPPPVPPAYPPRANNDPTSPGIDRDLPRNDPTRPGSPRERAKNDPTVVIDGERPRNDPTRPGTPRERAKNDPTVVIDGERPRNDPTRPGIDRDLPRNDPTRPGGR